MYKGLNKADTESNKVKVDFIKDDMINFKKDIENASKDDVDKIEKMNKIQILLNVFFTLIMKIKKEVV